jgi:thioester reductase-like protein
MPEPDWTELSSDVDVIIHNAWKVDFNHSLKSFEDTHIRGVRNFINASINSPKHPSIMFISSISSVGGWPARSVVPETPHQDYNAASRLGYGESKHVAERILSIAAERSAVPSSILRVGQIAGPLRKDGGLWNKTEWFPSLVKTSLSLGLFPETLAPIDWIPVDELAKVIVEIMHARLYNNDSEVFNLVNPTLSSWGALLEPLLASAGPEARVVPLKEWVATVRQLGGRNTDEASARPALKIIDFFEGMAEADHTASATYQTEHGRTASKTLSRLPAVKPEWMRIWLEQWKF